MAQSVPVSSAFGWRSDPFTGKATFHKGVGDRQVEVSGAVGPQGRIFFVASGTFRDSGVLDTVSWTDGEGKRITVDASK